MQHKEVDLSTFKSVIVKFVDFWPNFNPSQNFFVERLLTGLTYRQSNPIRNDKDTLLIFSHFGNQNELPENNTPNVKRIFYSGENIDFHNNKYDLSLSHKFDEENNLYCPLYLLHYYGNRIHSYIGSEGKTTDILFKQKEYKRRDKFCAFLYSNGNMNYPGVAFRNKLFAYLNSKQKVDAPLINKNVDYSVEDKIEWLKDYRFAFAIENSSTKGYSSEKIMDPMLAGSIPIYWGDETIGDRFNETSFINGHKFKNIKELGDYILYLDNTEHAYQYMYEKQFCYNKEIFSLEHIKNKIKELVGQ